MARYTAKSIDYYYNVDSYGILKDTYIDDANPTFNHGVRVYFQVGYSVVGSNYGNSVLRIILPPTEEILGFDGILHVRLYLKVQDDDNQKANVIGIIKIIDDFDEGTKTGAVGDCNWVDRTPAVPWSKGNGAVATREGSIDSAEDVFDSLTMVGISNGEWIHLDLTGQIDMEETKTFVIVLLERDATGTGVVAYHSRDAASSSDRPYIKLTYRSFPPEGFEGDEGLIIEPYEDNRTQPKLTWGAVDVVDFLQYKLYRDTSPITTIDGFKSAITAVSTVNDEFTIAGEHGDAFPVGSTFKVSGRAAENGRFTVKSVVESGTTVIETEEDITVATVDGDIHHGIWTSIDPATAEFIDTFAHVDNSTYYYKLIAEDQDNHEDDALLSAPVFFTKPDITTITLSDTGVQNVGILETITVVSPQNIKKIFIDWDDELGGDGDVESWYEYEIVGLSKTANHIYSRTFNGAFTGVVNIGGGEVNITAEHHNISTGDDVRIYNSTHYNGTYVATYTSVNSFKITAAYVATDSGDYRGLHYPSGRVQDEKGFWSSLTTVSTPVELIDTTPTAKLRVSIKKETLGDDVALDGSLSQPAASNIIITKYEFKRDAADSYQDNGTDPVYTFDSGTYPNSVGSKTASLRITTGSGETDTDTATYELETGTPTTLSFSKDTKIHEWNHILGQNKTVDLPVGSAGVEHEFFISKRAERITLIGTSNHPNTGDDIELIRSAWNNNTYVRITVSTEMEDHVVQYDCKIDGDISLGQAYDNKQSWTFPIRVITRTEL